MCPCDKVNIVEHIYFTDPCDMTSFPKIEFWLDEYGDLVMPRPEHPDIWNGNIEAIPWASSDLINWDSEIVVYLDQGNPRFIDQGRYPLTGSGPVTNRFMKREFREVLPAD